MLSNGQHRLSNGTIAGMILVAEIKETSITARSNSASKVFRLEVTRVDAFSNFDARIRAQSPVDLVVANVEGDDFARPMLQQAIGEAAG